MSLKRIALVTSDHRRHRWVAARLAGVADLSGVVVESKPSAAPSVADRDLEIRSYFEARSLAEERTFGAAPEFESLGATIIRTTWQGTNSLEVFEFLSTYAPDLVFLFGSAIVRPPLLDHFAGRMINMHLGLSPYYRGSATNFWPLVDGLPECVGVTVHHATAEVDGGAILGQARPDASADDDSHSLGCKAVIAGADVLCVMAEAKTLPEGVPQTTDGKLCRRKDFSLDALRTLQRNFANGMMSRYLVDKAARDRRFPIVTPVPPRG